MHSSYRVKSVEKAMRLLMLFSAKSPNLSLNEISSGLCVHKSTAYRMAMTLVEDGFLHWDSNCGNYSLGFKILELSYVLINSLELRSQARPHLERLKHDTDETVHLAVLDQGEVVYIDKLEADRAFQLNSGVGKKAPCHCTALGKVLMADLPDEKVRFFMMKAGMKGYTPNTLVAIPGYLAHLKQVRKDGYALDLEEHEPMIYCIGVPIRDYSGRVVAAFSITMVIKHFSGRIMDSYISIAKETGVKISTDMGYVNKEMKCEMVQANKT